MSIIIISDQVFIPKYSSRNVAVDVRVGNIRVEAGFKENQVNLLSELQQTVVGRFPG